MKKIVILVILFFYFAELNRSFSQSANLELKTKVIERKFCSNTNLKWKLELSYINKGDVPILLDRESNVIFRFSTISSKTDINKTADVIEPFIDLLEVLRKGFPTEDQFIILRKNESFSFVIPAGMLISDGTEDTEDYLHSGKYNLQITVATWYYQDTLKNEFREKWRNKGYLWTNDVTSIPMKFEVPKKKIIVSCDNAKNTKH